MKTNLLPAIGTNGFTAKPNFSFIAAAIALLLFACAPAHSATPYVMSNGNYLEGFDDIANWTDNFASGIGAAPWSSVPTNAPGSIPDGIRTTGATDTFKSGSSGGVQKGTGAILLLSTGTTDNSSACAIDLFLDFTGVTAGTLSFDWAEVTNSTGNRASSLRVYTSTDGASWTELGSAAVLNLPNNVPASGSIVQVPLPASFNNSSTARIRFYEYNGTGGNTGSRAKISIDNVAVTAGGGTQTFPSITAQPASRTNNAGTTATFTVSASGGSLFYLWKKNGNPLSDGGNISGSTTPTLTMTNVLSADAGNYSVQVTNNAGSSNSAIAVLTVIDPVITTQPVSRTNVAGDIANFFIGAHGTPTLTYQWRSNGTNIPGETASSLNITNVQTANQGSYSVVVSNGVGASLTSSVATLTLLATPSSLITRWDFNEVFTPLSPTPSVGSGTASLLNGASGAFANGSFSDAAGPPPSTSAWNTSAYATQGTSNKLRGVQFNVSTVGFKDILLTWEERHSDTASKYIRLQYSSDGVNFTDGPVITMTAQDNSFVFYSADLSGIPGINNNPNFAFRFVQEWESTAINTANANYDATVSTYGPTGTIRYDLLNVFGNAGANLTIQQLGADVVLSWTDPSFFLYASPAVTGTYSKIVGASSPYTNSSPANQRYFRLQSN